MADDDEEGEEDEEALEPNTNKGVRAHRSAATNASVPSALRDGGKARASSAAADAAAAAAGPSMSADEVRRRVKESMKKS